MADLPTIQLFTGFSGPERNYFDMPLDLIAALPLFETLAELKIVLYVLRHTWGFREYDSSKRITIDEFVHGRKRKDGTRIDTGVGMVKNSIKDGIERAVKHGFMIVETDDTDKARIEKSYSLQRVKDCTPEGQRLTLGVPNIDPRTEIYTLDTIPKIDTSSKTSDEKLQSTQITSLTEISEPKKKSSGKRKKVDKPITESIPQPGAALIHAYYCSLPDDVRPPGKPSYSHYHDIAESMAADGITPYDVVRYMALNYDGYRRWAKSKSMNEAMSFEHVNKFVKGYKSISKGLPNGHTAATTQTTGAAPASDNGRIAGVLGASSSRASSVPAGALGAKIKSVS